MVPIKPHSILVWPMHETPGPGGVLNNPSPSGSAATAMGFFEPMTPSDAQDRFGVQLRLPAALMVDPADAGKFSNGSEVLVEGRYYTVIGEPVLLIAGLESDHAEVLVEGKDFPVKGV